MKPYKSHLTLSYESSLTGRVFLCHHNPYAQRCTIHSLNDSWEVKQGSWVSVRKSKRQTFWSWGTKISNLTCLQFSNIRHSGLSPWVRLFSCWKILWSREKENLPLSPLGIFTLSVDLNLYFSKWPFKFYPLLVLKVLVLFTIAAKF